MGCRRSRRRRERAGAAGFASLSPDDRESVLRRIEQSHAELFEALVRHTYDGYYSHPTVIARLGLDAGPPHPRGHRVEAVDLPDLARVTARGPIYRPAVVEGSTRPRAVRDRSAPAAGPGT